MTDHIASILLEYHRKTEAICPIIFHKESGEYLNLSRPQSWLKLIYKSNPQLKKHITVHGFRHTYATLNKGEDMTDVQAVMGHATLSMTQHYTHSTQDGQNRVRDFMNGLGL